MFEMFPSALYSTHEKISPYRRNRFTVDYNRYLRNNEIFIVLDCLHRFPFIQPKRVPNRKHSLSGLWRTVTAKILSVIYVGLRVMCLSVLSNFNQNRNVLIHFSKYPKYNSWKSVQWKSRSSVRIDRPTNGRTDMMGLIVAFHRCSAKGRKSTAYSILCDQRIICNNKQNKIRVT
jgi:hypothetical protein